jgi:hypothetical protein
MIRSSIPARFAVSVCDESVAAQRSNCVKLLLYWGALATLYWCLTLPIGNR